MDRRSKLKDGEKGESGTMFQPRSPSGWPPAHCRVASAADVVNALRLRDFIHDVAAAVAAANTIDQLPYPKKLILLDKDSAHIRCTSHSSY